MGDFCKELHEKTKKIHDESDKLINVKVAAILTDTEAWGKAIAEFYYVFETLEETLIENQDHPIIASILFKDLFRTSAFQADLQFYLGAEWKKAVSPSEPAQRYCDRIRQIGADDPTLLIAYVTFWLSSFIMHPRWP